MHHTLVFRFRIFMDKHPIFRKFVVPQAVFRVRPPNYFVFFIGNGSTRSTQKATMFGFRAEHFRNFLRSAQTLVILHFQITFVSVIFNGECTYIIPRLELASKLRYTLSDMFYDICHLTVDFLNIIVTVYDDRLGVRDIQNFLIADFVDFHIVLVKRLVDFDEDTELRQIQVCKRILVLRSSDVLLYDKLHTVVIQLMPYSAYDIRFRLFLTYLGKQTFHIFQLVIHIFGLLRFVP